MKKSAAWMAVCMVLLLGLAGVTVIRGRSAAKRVEAAAVDSHDAGIVGAGEAAPSRKTKAHERPDDAGGRERQELRKRLEEMLPPLNPNAKSTLFEVKLHPGESIAVGGFKTKDGHIQTTLITPMASSDTGGVRPTYVVTSRTLVLDEKTTDMLGFAELKQGGADRLQQYVRVPSGAQAIQSKSVMCSPAVTSASDQRFLIEIGSPNQFGFSFSGMISSDGDEDNLLLRARLEYDGDLPPTP